MRDVDATVYASWRPSGDHAGPNPSIVTTPKLDPSRATTHSAHGVPGSWQVKTSRALSGAHRGGLESYGTIPGAMRVTTSVPSAFMTYSCPSINEMCAPSGDHAG